jgi:hypothetical protein
MDFIVGAVPAGGDRPAAPPSAPAALARQAADDGTEQLVMRLDAAMQDAQKGFNGRRAAQVGEAAGKIARESETHGLRVLARMAGCVERAAQANDMNAIKDLLPDLTAAVERNRIALTPKNGNRVR